MLKIALERKHITKQEFEILSYLIKKDDMSMKAKELDKFGIHKSKEKSNIMTKLKDKKMIDSIKKAEEFIQFVLLITISYVVLCRC